MTCGPANGCLNPNPPSWACSGLMDVARAIVTAGVDVLTDFVCDDGDCDLVGVVSHNEPAVDRCNVVVSWVANANLSSAPGSPTKVVLPRGLIRSQVWVQCWPIGMQPAALDEVSAISEALGALGETWYKTVHRTARDAYGGNCALWAPGPLIPVGPLGGCAGWQFDLTVQTDG